VGIFLGSRGSGDHLPVFGVAGVREQASLKDNEDLSARLWHVWHSFREFVIGEKRWEE